MLVSYGQDRLAPFKISREIFVGVELSRVISSRIGCISPFVFVFVFVFVFEFEFVFVFLGVELSRVISSRIGYIDPLKHLSHAHEIPA